MRALNKRELLRRLPKVRARIQQRIDANSGGKYGGGLATEGWDGGYMAAINDVEAMLAHGYPSDSRNDWSTEHANERSS